MKLSRTRAVSFNRCAWFSDPVFAAWIVRMLQAYGDSLIDVGAGTGLMIPSYVAQFRQVWALEPSPNMLRVLRRSKGLQGAVIVAGAAENIPFPDRHVDLAVAKSTLHHFANWRKALREMARVSRRAIAVIEVIAPNRAALAFAKNIVGRKEQQRPQDAFYTGQKLRAMVGTVTEDCHILNFDQYIEVDPWLRNSDVSIEEQIRIRALILSQPSKVREVMQIHERHGKLVMLRRMCMAVGFLGR